MASRTPHPSWKPPSGGEIGALPPVDLHVHTVYSGHAGSPSRVEDMVAAARSAGLERVVILEHVPPSAVGLEPRAWLELRDQRDVLDQIALEVEEARGLFPEVEVLLGVEVDADPVACDGSLMLSDLSDLDWVVASTPLLPGGDAYWYDRFRVVPAARTPLARRWAAWAERIVSSGEIDALAHPELLLAVCGCFPALDSPEALETFEPVLAAMAAHGVAFEINEASSWKLPPALLQSLGGLLRRALALGVRFSLASDAHCADGVGGFRRLAALAKELRVPPEAFVFPEREY